MIAKIKIVLFLLVFSLCSNDSFCQEAISIRKLSTKGTPIIFLPHIGCSGRMWEEVAQNYTADFACYIIDFAGFAGKPALQGNYTESYLKALNQFMRQKDISECILVGQNYGGYIASKLAAENPGKVKAMILCDFYPKLSMVLDKEMTREKLRKITASVKDATLTPDSISFANYQKQAASGMNFMDTSFVPQFVQWQLSSDRATLAGSLIEQLEDDMLPYFETNTVPSVIFSTWYFAKQYQKMPMALAEKTLNEMYPGAKNIQHAITEDAKDFIACDQPRWFIDQLNKFLHEQGRR